MSNTKIMTAKELMFIKSAQKEYLEKFGSNLIVDFRAMKKLPTEYTLIKYTNVPFDTAMAVEFLEKSCKKNKTTIESIKKRLNNSSKYLKERKVLKEYAEFIYKNGWSPREAAEFVDKERTTIVYHNSKKTLLKTRKSK